MAVWMLCLCLFCYNTLCFQNSSTGVTCLILPVFNPGRLYFPHFMHWETEVLIDLLKQVNGGVNVWVCCFPGLHSFPPLNSIAGQDLCGFHTRVLRDEPVLLNPGFHLPPYQNVPICGPSCPELSHAFCISSRPGGQETRRLLVGMVPKHPTCLLALGDGEGRNPQGPLSLQVSRRNSSIWTSIV